MNQSTETQRLLRAGRRLWWLILVLALAGALMGFVVSQRMPQVFQATTSVLVGESLRSANVEEGDIKASTGLAPTYADIVRRQPVLQAVVNRLDLDEDWLALRRDVRVDVASNNAQLIVVTVEARSRARAVAIANGIAAELVALNPQGSDATAKEFVRSQLNGLRAKIEATQQSSARLETQLAEAITPEARAAIQLEVDEQQALVRGWQANYAQLAALGSGDSSTTSLQVLERAYALPQPIRPRVSLNVLLAVFLGGALGLAIGYLLELRPPRPKHGSAPWLAVGPHVELRSMLGGTPVRTPVQRPRPETTRREDDREVLL